MVSFEDDFHHATPSQVTRFLGSRQDHPWCGLRVIISKVKHVWKGTNGVITGVSYGPEGKLSEIRLEVRVAHYNPAAPFRTITVDYDDVVESL